MDASPDRPIARLDTPLEAAPRLAAAIGLDGDQLSIKRDDLTGHGGGGNKLRKLERLLTDAAHRGATTLVTAGGVQSNHVRLTAATAARYGYACEGFLATTRVIPEGNVILDQLFGATLHLIGPADLPRLNDHVERRCQELADQGTVALAIPVGGSNPIGASGYVTCADEITAQLGTDVVIVCASGSGGTHAGLVAGTGTHDNVLGFDVGATNDLHERIGPLADATAALVGRPTPTGALQLDNTQIGGGYGAPTEACLEALSLVARTEGLVLDPVYTGKAMAGLISHAREQRLADRPVVFVHTGGMPALFTARYTHWFEPRAPGGAGAVTS